MGTKHSSAQRDYKSLAGSSSRTGPNGRRYRLHLFAVVAAGTALATLLAIPSFEANAIRDEAPAQVGSPGSKRVTVPLELELKGGPAPEPLAQLNLSPLEQPPAEPEADTGTDEGDWEAVTVQRGDTLAAIFNRQNLPARDLHDIISLGEPTDTLKRLYPGQEFRIRVDEHGRLQSLVYKIDALESLRVERDAEGQFTAEAQTRPLEVRTSFASAQITNSLFLSGQEAGLANGLIMELADIFGWDIDFVLDIREGDSFNVLYEEHYLDGEKVKDGAILAAEFTNQGKTYQAVRFEDADGRGTYFAPNGLSMRKAFLRSPVHFSRISSRFGKRHHPVYNRVRSHKGVDYAAPTGTPIRAAGDGKVIFRGTKGGYGRTVILQHGGRYSTLYAHMSRFASGMKTGTRVKQGQVIGYVGMSGTATGPHLHYEFRINGVHRNPLTVQLPQADPIGDDHRDIFERHARRVLAQLDLHKQTELALEASVPAQQP